MAFRLHRALDLLQDAMPQEHFSIAKMATILSYKKVTKLENYFLGKQEPCLEELKKIPDVFYINFN